MRRLLGTLLFLFTAFGSSARADRVGDLVKQMTLEEKITLIGGDLFATKAIPRLGIPALKMSDGPIGVRWQTSTAFPSGISMGASFNRELVYRTVSAMAVETRAHGRDMLLGPCVGISRQPFGGRNFEGMGEDPFLTSETVAQYVRALNDGKVVGSVKHFGLNDQEYRRMDINSVADERTMHEIHLVAFERAVNEGVGSVMASYNKLNGTYASENSALLNGILKRKWGFKGFVISDWGATHSVVPAALAGLDLEMPFGDNFGPELLKAVKTEAVPEDLINDKVSRLLTQIERIGLLDGADANRPSLDVINSPAHQQLALEMARESHVLLKNQGLLPLDATKLKSIAVIGPNADVYVNGGGSSAVETLRKISTLAGLRAHLPANVKLGFSAGSHAPGAKITPAHLSTPDGKDEGLLGEYFDNMELKGAPKFTRVDQTVDFFWDENQSPDPRITNTRDYSVRWTGSLHAFVSGDYVFNTLSDDGIRLYLDGKLVIDNWTNHGTTENTRKMRLTKGHAYKIKLEYYQGTGNAVVRFGWTPPAEALLKDAVDLAARSEVAVVHVGFNADSEGEAQDRDMVFDLPKEQVALIQAVAAVNPNTIVVINSGNPVGMGSWLPNVKAVIYAWFAGQEAGNALSDILLGTYNPSGRLPVTLYKRWEDSPAYGTYPEQNGETIYKEGVYVGYRHFDKTGIVPEYPFGYGLSYTSFLYSDLKLKTDSLVAANPDVTVSATITNKGTRAGSEVVQLYVADQQPKVDRPVQELKGFEKVFLQPGESQTVSFRLNKRSFAYYDVTIHDWNVQPGRFNLRVSSSSRDHRLNGDVTLTGP